MILGEKNSNRHLFDMAAAGLSAVKFVILIFYFFSFSAFAGPSFKCSIVFGKKHFWSSNLVSSLKTGQKIKLQYGDNEKPSDVFFIGRFNHPQFEDTLYFWNEAQNTIAAISRENVNMDNGEELKGILDKGGYLQFPKIKRQRAVTCAFHAPYNCMKVLRLNGQGTQELEAIFTQNPLQSLQNMRSYVAYGSRNFGNKSGNVQRQRIMDQFEKQGYQIKEEQNIWPLIRHLKKGFPAVVTSNVGYGSKIDTWMHDGKKGSYGKSHPEQDAPHHAVAAVGYIPTGLMSGKIVILDSNLSEFTLWDTKDLSKVDNKEFYLISPK